MRPRGTGTIEQTADGFRPRLPGRNGQRLPMQGTFEAAKHLLAATLEKLTADPARGGLTLAAYGYQVIDRRDLAGQRSARTDRNRWRAHVERSGLGDIPLDYVQRADVVAWCDELATKKAQPGRCHKGKVRDRVISKQTAQNALTMVRVVFGDAVDRGLLEANPAATVKLPAAVRKRARSHETWTYLLPEEQTKLITAACVPERERLAIQFTMGIGTREDEQWAIELRDLNMKAKTVTLRKTKNGKPRTLPLLPLALDAVERWLPLLAKQENPKALLWPTLRGCRRRGDHPQWQKWLRELELVPEKRHDGKHVRYHDLRHTCATSLLCGWWGRRWSLEEVQALLDHESKTTTERYAHIAESVLEDAARESAEVTTRVTTDVSRIASKPLAPPARVERTTNGLGNAVSFGCKLLKSERIWKARPVSKKAVSTLFPKFAGGPDLRCRRRSSWANLFFGSRCCVQRKPSMKMSRASGRSCNERHGRRMTESSRLRSTASGHASLAASGRSACRTAGGSHGCVSSPDPWREDVGHRSFICRP